MRKGKTLKQRVAERVRRLKADVFLPGDFADLGNYDQVKRALRGLIQEQVIARLGYGVYARLRTNPLTGQPALAAKGGFDGAVRQALRKLEVDWDETQLVKDYNAGRTTQVQMNSGFAVRGRFSRKLKYKNLEASFLRRLPDELLDDVADAVGLPSGQVVEKDYRVIELLSVINAAKMPDGARMVFAGGTCLACAHGVVQRMSEDVDLKIVLDGGPVTNSAVKTALSRVKGAVRDAIVAAGFQGPPITAKYGVTDSSHNVSLPVDLKPCHVIARRLWLTQPPQRGEAAAIGACGCGF